MEYPRIVFCTTCKGRVQHLERTLPRNIADNQDYPNARFVVLDYNSPDSLLGYLHENHGQEIASGLLTVYGYYDWPGPFRMSHAKNMAHRCGILEGADILVNMDADNFASPGFASWIAEQFLEHPDAFLWCNAKSVVGRARQGLAGRVAVSRDMFLRSGGYDERRYAGWAPEDEDFKARVKRLGCHPIPIEDRFLYVIPHKDGLRFKEYPDAKPTPEREAASLKAIRDAEHTIANWGDIGCGTVRRPLTGDPPIELKPLPTRVFGIGFQKTATTSLHTAFRLLGLNSAHWTGPWWAKRIWEEMATWGRSLTLEQHYALCDFPIAILYRELDKAYPGSKFILTVRDDDAWLRSVRNHWVLNRKRFDWDHDCFTHRMHKLVYARKEFDAEIFLERYRRHNAEVLEYFRDRPGDLLVMDMQRGAGWRELCPFLGLPVPATSYPFAFAKGE